MTNLWRRPSTILAATDLTPSSDIAVERAIELAAYWGARLYIAHVVDDTHSPGEAPARARLAEAEIEKRVKSSPAASSVEIEVLTTVGHPADRLLAKCDRLFVDLLVMGQGDRKTLTQRLLGTTVDRVVRQSLQPVLTVRKRSTGPYRNVAIATDFSATSEVARDCALGLFPSAQATVVHAHELDLHGLFSFDVMTGPLAERHALEIIDYSEKAMKIFIANAKATHSGLKSVIEVGQALEVMVTYAKAHEPDLVVLGTHGRTGIRRAVIGSVTEQLLNRLECDVLVVRHNA